MIFFIFYYSVILINYGKIDHPKIKIGKLWQACQKLASFGKLLARIGKPFFGRLFKNMIYI
jgi:hypothetical protein